MSKEITLEDFSLLVASIHEAALDAQGWSRFLADFARVLEVPKGGLISFGKEGPDAVVNFGYDVEATRQYVEYYHALDNSIDVLFSRPSGRADSVYSMLPTHSRAKTEYLDYRRRFDIGDSLAAWKGSGATHRLMIAMQRPFDAPAFGDAEKRLLTLLMPHIGLATRAERTLADAKHSQGLIAAALDKVAHAVFIVDEKARVRHMNAAAAVTLGKRSHIRYQSGFLRFIAPGLNHAFQAAVRISAGAQGSGSALPVPGTDLEVVVMPLNPGNPLAADWQRPLAIVILSMPPSEPAAIAGRMRSLYGLTLAEAEVTAALALGRSFEEIAADRKARASTLRTQLRSIFAKTGARNQADLVRLALSGFPASL